MARTVGVREAKVQPSALIDRAPCGEGVIISRRGTAVVRPVPVQHCRRPGSPRGCIRIAPDLELSRTAA